MSEIVINFDFVNPIQREYFYCNKRNQNFNGSFGNGKSFGASMKALALLCTFPNYRIGISRYSAKELQQSTMSTFFKICPPELYNEAYGGRRNDRDGYLRLINRSEVLWMHLDDFSDGDLRGKEFNSVLTDQGEEISEEIYDILDARMERWDMAKIPDYLDAEQFPKNRFTHKPMPPCYNMLLFNPDTTLHWIYRRLHPESDAVEQYCGHLQRTSHIRKTEYAGEEIETSGAWFYPESAYFTASMHDNPAIPESLKRAYLKRDKQWIHRFYFGRWGIAGGAIHQLSTQSIIDFAKKENRDPIRKLLEVIQKDGIKYRSMDHGEGAPTCCLWFAYLSPTVIFKNYGVKSKGIHICYREYYQPAKIIKYHRERIAELSGNERYFDNFADPQIFKKTTQKYGGFWSVSDDYLDTRDYDEEDRKKAPPITWQPADNNEFSCRDAVNRLLELDEQVFNPITGEHNSPSLYFIKRHNTEYPYGALNAINQLASQRRKKIASLNGEDIYSDERADVTDHAYDPTRYYAIMPKMRNLPEAPKATHPNSFHARIRQIRMANIPRDYPR